ncbi:hypothetical protein pb186bvf_016102 [Paramecium bursaria]
MALVRNLQQVLNNLVVQQRQNDLRFSIGQYEELSFQRIQQQEESLLFIYFIKNIIMLQILNELKYNQYMRGRINIQKQFLNLQNYTFFQIETNL